MAYMQLSMVDMQLSMADIQISMGRYSDIYGRYADIYGRYAVQQQNDKHFDKTSKSCSSYFQVCSKIYFSLLKVVSPIKCTYNNKV